jgi:putative ABC transport system substrate-binding protein
MRRREFVAIIGGTLAWPLAARAQQRSLPVIGFVDSRSVETMGYRLNGFRRGLEEGGLHRRSDRNGRICLGRE